jgi:hypothetical protein
MRASNHWRQWAQLGILVALGLPSPAAQAQLEPRVSGRPGEEHIRSGIGVSIQGGAAVSDFTGRSSRGVTNVGGSWDVRAVLGTRRLLAVEGAYVGSLRSLTSPTLPVNSTNLIANGVEGDLRLNVPLLLGEVLVEPFGFVGAGWSHYYLSNLGSGVVLSNTDNVGTIPAGAGLAVAHQRFLVEARFTYRSVFDDNQILLAGMGRALGLDNWNVGLMFGYEF